MYPRYIVTGERGAIVLIVALSAVALFGFAALAIDGSYLMVAKHELQNAADAAAHAGALKLGQIYNEGLGDPYSDENSGDIQEQAQSLSNQATGYTGYPNIGANQNEIEIKNDDIKVGRWDVATGRFTESSVPANAVRVIARRNDLANQPVSTFFASVLGDYSKVGLEATAIAALTPLSQGNCFPFSVSQKWLEDNSDGSSDTKTIHFHPTKTSCAGWNTCREKSNADDLVCNISRLAINGNEQCNNDLTKESVPFVCSCQSGDTIEHIGGTINKAFKKLEEEYPHITTEQVVPVYAGGCSNPSGPLKIVDFVRFNIIDVRPADDFEIDVTLIGALDGPGGGSGSGSGVLSTRPKFVQ